MVERLAVAGEPRACADTLRRLREAGADTVVLVPPHGPEAALRQLEKAAEEVLPALR